MRSPPSERTESMPHPLDQLTPDEIRRASATLSADAGVGPSFRYASLTLAEPAKTDLLAWTPGSPLPRRARAVVWDRSDNRTYEALVDLTDSSAEVVSFIPIPGVTPNFTVDEWHDCETAMKADPQVIAALAERGVTDLDLVLIDVWTFGLALMPERYRDRRLGWADIWIRSGPGANPYAGPLSGLKLIVDMNTMELLELDESEGPIAPRAPVRGEYAPALVEGQQLRTDLKPLEVTQPDGVSFTLDGHALRWQNWSMRIGFNDREGLVLHQVGYADGGTTRSVAHRMSFAEMIVPYRDSSFDHYRRTAYDIGEWGLGNMTTSLTLGCDCLGEIRYLDATLADSRGEPFTIENAVCIHEEDNAVLWKHVDPTASTEVRRMRRLVVSIHATVANYEYLVYWRFYQDGNIECEVRATGIMVTTPIADGAATPATGTLVDQRTYAPFHQHFLVARLDLDIDGQANEVLEIDSMAAPISAANPQGLDLVTTATRIADESMAGRDYNWATQRSWKVQSTERTNGLGTPVAYKLVPTGCFPSMMDPTVPQYLRAPVIGHNLWVTRHHDDERWPAGTYPTQSEVDEGMTRWTADAENLVGTDVVLWYVFGLHHLTRPEDWPVMPADTVSFWLKPFGFFDRNPSLDVAPAPGHGAVSTAVEGGVPAGHCH
ncbi:MAG: primary-amine oxidase [Nakamurella sp.]